MKYTVCCISLQGFLSDLLEKANRHYDDKKLNEYTETIVSVPVLGYGPFILGVRWPSG